MIQIINGNKTLKKQHVLKDVNLHLKQGEICGIVGNNGSGKTVMFKCILGIYLFDDGELLIRGQKRRKMDGIAQGISAVIENPAFLENHSGLQNLRYLYELNHKKDVKYLKQVLEQVGLNPNDRKKVKNYSLGMKQRLAIAQAIMDDNDLLILDEPMNGLDKNGVDEIRQIILKLKSEGKSILIASHNREDISILCDRVYEMDGGVLRLLEEEN